MQPSLVPFTQDHLDAALDLFVETYRQEREHSPLLPSRAIDDPHWLREAIRSSLANPGVAAVYQGQLLAYMATGATFRWKRLRAALVPEYCHAAVVSNKHALYQLMYQGLAEDWAHNHIQLHTIGHFAHDSVIRETLYELGFGALIAERLRDLSDVCHRPDIEINATQDVDDLVDLDIEHSRYYAQSPIFVSKATEESEVRATLAAQVEQGDVFFVHYENQRACAYMTVGESAVGGEGFLLQNTRTAQIKSAYVQPRHRGTGIGTALLQRTISWSRQRGCERQFVEHETANILGGNLWRRHFTPYLYFSMRYIDATI